MKNMSKSGKFLVTCAIIFAIGLVLTIGGCVAGGPDGFEKMVRDEGFTIEDGAVETATDQYDFEFSSIEARGEADFIFVGSKYYNDIVRDKVLLDTEAKPGKVVAIYDKEKKAPEVRTEGDRLIIDGGRKENSISLAGELFEPTVIVFVDDKDLESVSVSSASGDLEMLGVSFKTADLGMNAGDLDLKDIISGGMKIDVDAGDVEISGVLRGTTDVTTDAGDVEIDVFSGTAAYTMDLHTDAGEIKVGEEEIDGGSYKQKGGADVIRVEADAGEIEIGEL